MAKRKEATFLPALVSERKRANLGSTVIKRLIRVLLYADDAALLALSSGGLVALLTTFNEYCAAFGLRVSFNGRPN